MQFLKIKHLKEWCNTDNEKDLMYYIFNGSEELMIIVFIFWEELIINWKKHSKQSPIIKCSNVIPAKQRPKKEGKTKEEVRKFG